MSGTGRTMLAKLQLAAGALLTSLAVVGAPVGAAEGATGARVADGADAGRALYLEGRRADGTPLRARRAGGQVLTGAQAACVNCHRRSAMGGAEGRSYIPPIRAQTLLQAQPPGKGPSATGVGRPAYTAATLHRALTTGTDPAGRALDFLMPRYELRDDEVRALTAYLGSLADAPAEAASLHFATVIAPGVPAQSRQAMVDVLQACFAEHNAGRKAERGRRKLALEMGLRQPPAWTLHVWDLQGEEGAWDAQLASLAAKQPVFAMVGGVGTASWAPVHRFCEMSATPCVFPHVEVPVDDPAAYYPFYLSKGVLLEAALMEQHLAAMPVRGKVVQVLREADATARAAADTLRHALERRGIAQRTVSLSAPSSSAAEVLAAADAQDVLVLWLRPGDLQRLATVAPPQAQVLLSATLAERDAVPLPAAWKARALMAYPFELPQLRSARTQRMQQWLRAKGLAASDERVQADAYLACASLGTAMRDAEDHLGREYLIDKLEMNVERWHVLGLYPRLALGTAQRFASKTGYVVRFEGDGLTPLGERAAP